MELIDTHAHLDQADFAADLDAVLARAATAGVSNILSIGVTAATSRNAVALAERYPQVWAVVGIQPNYCHEAGPDDYAEIERLSQHPRVVAIGETGLDRYWDHAPFPLQQDYFRRHIALARQRDLPFVVHCRQCEADIVEVLQAEFAQHGPLRGVMHSFCGDAATADACLAVGMHLSFAGMVTFKKNDELRQVSLRVPLDRLLVETDSPYLAPQPVRGKRNEPGYVVHTATCLAAQRGMALAELAAHTTRNARQLFRLPAAAAS